MPASWYDANADIACATYEKVDPERLNGWILELVPGRHQAVDIGAGSGRDAAYFARSGFTSVIAAEPSLSMRIAAAGIHGDISNLAWMDASLPDLSAVYAAVAPADLVMAAGVWQHVPTAVREPAMASMASLLRPGGTLCVKLRHSPQVDTARGMLPVCLGELLRLADAAGLSPIAVRQDNDISGRAEVRWTAVVLRKRATTN